MSIGECLLLFVAPESEFYRKPAHAHKIVDSVQYRLLVDYSETATAVVKIDAENSDLMRSARSYYHPGLQDK